MGGTRNHQLVARAQRGSLNNKVQLCKTTYAHIKQAHKSGHN